MRRRQRGATTGDELSVKAEINVTSLVDVAFTLLVIFIITAPILQGGVEVAVPRADVRRVGPGPPGGPSDAALTWKGAVR